LGINPLTNQIFMTTASGLYPPTGFTLTIFNGSSESISSVIPFKGIPGDLALNPNTGRVFVINGSSIAIFEGKTGGFVGAVPLGVPLYAVAVNPSTIRIYATSENTLFQITPANPASDIQRFPIGRYAVALAVNPSTNVIYAANFDSNTVSVFDISNQSLVATVDLGTVSLNPSALGVNSATNKVFVATSRNSVVVIDGTTNKVVGTVKVGDSRSNSTYAIAIDQRKNQVYVASEPSPLITIIDGASYAILGRIRIGYSPYQMGVNPDTGKLYVTDYHMLTIVENEAISSSPQNLASELIVAAGLALLFSYLVWRRSGRLHRIREENRVLNGGAGGRNSASN